MAEQVPREGLSVRRHVEGLVVGDAREGAGGDVADRVAAGLLRRQTHRRQLAHHRLDLREGEEVELHVLARREVDEAPGVDLGHVGERLHLPRLEHAFGDLDAQHLGVLLLALAVGAARAGGRGCHSSGVISPRLERAELPDEGVDVADVGEVLDGRRSVLGAHEHLLARRMGNGDGREGEASARRTTSPMTMVAGGLAVGSLDRGQLREGAGPGRCALGVAAAKQTAVGCRASKPRAQERRRESTAGGEAHEDDEGEARARAGRAASR